MAAYGHALDGRAIYNFQSELQPVNEQIVEILIHSSIENFHPRLQPNSEQKADEMHVSPAIAKSPCNLKNC